MKTTTTIVLALMLATGATFAQNFNKAKMDSLFQVLDANQQSMACVTISKNKEVIYSRAIGYEKITHKDKLLATPKSKYRIGSISKMITATIIFQFIEEGKISLTTPLAQFFSNIPNAQKITIANLLNHRSGLSDIKERSEFGSVWINQPHTEAEILGIIEQADIKHQPNQKSEYSNSGFILLSYIVQKIGGKPYKTILQERICKKIGLKDTYYEPTRGTRPHECFSYQWKDEAWEQMPETDLSIPTGAGAIVATTADLNRFMGALFRYQIISQKSLDYMKTIIEGLGSGMFEFPYNNQKGYGHNGDIDGFSSFSLHFPDENVSITYFTNGKVYSKDAILRAILAIYFKQPYRIPSFEMLTSTTTFRVDMRDELKQVKAPETIGIRGNITPLSWDKTYPMTDSNKDGIYETTLTIKARANTGIEYKYNYDNSVWENGQNHYLTLQNTQVINDKWNFRTDQKQLYDEISIVDSLFFGSFNNRNIEGMKRFMSEDLEFYHDITGLTNYEQNVKIFQTNFTLDRVTTRELLAGSTEIYPIKGYGAIQTGLHRFCTTQNGETGCSIYKFMSIWKKTNEQWKVTRIVSYDH